MKERDEQPSLVALGRQIKAVAHEFNNPLVGISMTSQLMTASIKTLKDTLTQPNLDRQRVLEVVAQLETALRQMTHSVTLANSLKEDLLTFGQPFERALTEIRPLLEAILGHLEGHPNLQGLSLHPVFQVRPSPVILCNALKMEQVIYNLLNNAARATHGHGEVWIRQELEGDTVVIEVEDNGPGLSDALLAKIAKDDDVIPESQGHGLGLAICREIVVQHGGTFSVYNKPSSGACFRLAFPEAVGRHGHHVV